MDINITITDENGELLFSSTCKSVDRAIEEMSAWERSKDIPTRQGDEGLAENDDSYLEDQDDNDTVF